MLRRAGKCAVHWKLRFTVTVWHRLRRCDSFDFSHRRSNWCWCVDDDDGSFTNKPVPFETPNCGLLLFFSCENRTWLACGTVDLLNTSLQSAGEEKQDQGRCGRYAKHSGGERGNRSTCIVGVGGDSERVLVEILCNRDIYQKQDTPNSEYNRTLM